MRNNLECLENHLKPKIWHLVVAAGTLQSNDGCSDLKEAEGIKMKG